MKYENSSKRIAIFVSKAIAPRSIRSPRQTVDGTDFRLDEFIISANSSNFFGYIAADEISKPFYDCLFK